MAKARPAEFAFRASVGWWGLPREVHPTQALPVSSMVRPAYARQHSLHSVDLSLLAHLGTRSFFLPGQGGKKAIHWVRDSELGTHRAGKAPPRKL